MAAGQIGSPALALATKLELVDRIRRHGGHAGDDRRQGEIARLRGPVESDGRHEADADDSRSGGGE